MDDFMIETFSVPAETRPLPCSCQTCMEATFDPFIFDYSSLGNTSAQDPKITTEQSIEEAFFF